jgi:hypothetical protein
MRGEKLDQVSTADGSSSYRCRSLGRSGTRVTGQRTQLADDVPGSPDREDRGEAGRIHDADLDQPVEQYEGASVAVSLPQQVLPGIKHNRTTSEENCLSHPLGQARDERVPRQLVPHPVVFARLTVIH